MADKKVSDFTEAATVADGDWIEVENAAGNSRKMKRSLVRGKALLAEQIADASVGTYTFSGLPGDWTNLIIEITARSTNASVGTNCFIRFNGDTGANYDTETHRSDNATASANPSAGATSMFIGEMLAASGLAGEAGRAIIEVPNYASATFNKNALIRSGRKTSNAAAGLRHDTIYGAWRNAAAITSVTVFLTAGNFDAGSTIRIYGVS